MSRILFDSMETPAVASTASPDRYTRMMTALLPPGRLWRLIGSSVLLEVLAASADELGRLEQRSLDLLDEADPTTAEELLPEYEAELGLESTGSVGERQARVVARIIARQRYRPSDFQTALAPLLGQDAEDVDVIETSHAAALAIGDVREIFRFFIYRDPSLPGTYYVASAQELVDTIKPSHTSGHVIESINGLYDDPHTLYDRDLFGA